jgi:hypothetical protein
VGVEEVFQTSTDVGLDKLAVIHLNDSKGALGKHLDRHEHIGEGAIGPRRYERYSQSSTTARLAVHPRNARRRNHDRDELADCARVADRHDEDTVEQYNFSLARRCPDNQLGMCRHDSSFFWLQECWRALKRLTSGSIIFRDDVAFAVAKCVQLVLGEDDEGCGERRGLMISTMRGKAYLRWSEITDYYWKGKKCQYLAVHLEAKEKHMFLTTPYRITQNYRNLSPNKL